MWAARAMAYKFFLAKIGSLCYLGKPCYIQGKNHIYIGNKTRIFPGIRLEALSGGSIRIGNNTVIEQNVHIISMGDDLIIGNDVTLAPNVFISNVNHKYADVSKSVMDQGHIVTRTSIGDGCFIGYGAAIQPGTILGKHCVVGSNAVVKGTYSDYSVIVGNPGRVIKEYDKERNCWKKVD